MNQKERYTPNHKEPSFHKPPLTRGNYAFIPGFVEMFLVGWKLNNEDGTRKKQYERIRRFRYSGKIWTHLRISHPDVTYYRTHGNWYETDTSSLPHIIKYQVHHLNLDVAKRRCSDVAYPNEGFHNNWRFHALDDWEVFIEKI